MTGWRVGYAAAPAQILAAMRKVHQYTIMSAPTMSQVAALEALTSAEEYVQEMVGEYDRRRRLIVSGLNELGLSTFEPHGAFYAFPNIEATGLGSAEMQDYLLEEAGVATGAIYGPYHYTDRLGPKLFGVPLVVPMAWFMVIYPSYTVANYLADGRVASKPRPSPARLIGLSALSAMLMTAWDLAVDPQMVMYGHWEWHVEGAYFGIPVQNFVGWLVTTMTVYLVYRALEARWPPNPWGEATPPTFARLPLFIYGLLASGYTIGYALLGRPALALVVLFAMGTPCLAAALRTTEKTATR